MTIALLKNSENQNHISHVSILYNIIKKKICCTFHTIYNSKKNNIFLKCSHNFLYQEHYIRQKKTKYTQKLRKKITLPLMSINRSIGTVH